VPALNQRRGHGNTDTPASPALYPASCIGRVVISPGLE